MGHRAKAPKRPWLFHSSEEDRDATPPKGDSGSGQPDRWAAAEHCRWSLPSCQAPQPPEKGGIGVPGTEGSGCGHREVA